MGICVLALMGVKPERREALAAAGFEVIEGKRYPTRDEALRAGGAAVRAVLTNGRSKDLCIVDSAKAHILAARMPVAGKLMYSHM